MRLSFAFIIFLTTMLRLVFAQEPAPETAPPLFPKGALLSYASDFINRAESSGQLTPTSHPTFSHTGTFTFTWGFYRNFDVTVKIPVVTNRFNAASGEKGGTGIGDVFILVKYRFFRKDSPRGTNQVSLTVGPKFATGKTDLTDSSGNVLLPASMQPGSGSTDLFAGLNWTYTGLLNIRRLVADEAFHAFIRTEGTQDTRLGNEFESRFWISYRPYESKDVSREWFIGPTITWIHTADQRIAGIVADQSGGEILAIGVTSYVGIAAGFYAWLGVDWTAADSDHVNFNPIKRHISFGLTRQFSFF